MCGGTKMSYIFIYHLILEECKYKGLAAVCADKTSASQEQVLRLSQDYGEASVKSCTNLATNTALCSPFSDCSLWLVELNPVHGRLLLRSITYLSSD